MTRPYIQKTIADLEALFQTSTDDSATLKKLAQELKHRKVPRAGALEVRVTKALTIIASPPMEPTVGQTETMSSSDQIRTDDPVTMIPSTVPVDQAKSSDASLTRPDQLTDETLDAQSDAISHENIQDPTQISLDSPATVQKATPDARADQPEMLLDTRNLTPTLAYRLLKIPPGASWEIVEARRREIVQLSSPTALVGKGEADVETHRNNARIVNKAYALLIQERLSQQ